MTDSPDDWKTQGHVFLLFFQSTKRRKRQSKVVSSDVQEDVSIGKSFLKIS